VTDFDDELDDSPDEDDAGDDEPTILCPWCKRQIHEDAQRCPYCEQYISDEDAPRAARPWWIVVGVIVALCIVLSWILG
jgi:predicted nucleic acid-binding Zn ribbon protein